MKIVYFCKSNKHIQLMFHELFEDERVIVVDCSSRKTNNIILKMIKKIHLSVSVNELITLPWRRVWMNGRFPVINHDEEYIFLFTDFIPMTLDLSFLKKIRQVSHGKIKFVLFLFNPVSLLNRNIQYNMKRMTFDRILSYDFEDSRKYGFTYEMVPYSTVRYQPCPVEKDIYLICWNKGRLPLLHTIYQASLEHDVSSIYRITGVKEEDQIYDGIIYNQEIGYDEVIKEFLQCNCIMDMVAPGHTGVSIRYYEAVCYNKKLLTNNKNIVTFPFYDPKNMHIYEKVEDIDWDWVKERIPVDYHYDGRFSPVHLIDKIIELEEEKERKELGKNETS